jgi:hypothetical protein
MRITHVGQSTLHTSSHPLHLKDILQVPSVTRNLLSVKKFSLDNNVFFEFHPWYFFVKDRSTREVLLRGGFRGGLYNLDVSAVKHVFSSVKVSRSRWHSRLGHPASHIVQHVLHHNELPSESNNKDVIICDAANKARVVSYLFLFLPVFLHHHLSSYFLMFGVLPKNPLVVMSIMLALWMDIVVLHGFTSSNANLMCFKYSFSFNNMLNAYWVEK